MGAYTCALAWMAGIPMLICIFMGGATAFLTGIVFGLPALRIKGVHPAISTLAMQFTFYFIAHRRTAVTGGDNGLQPPQAQVFGFVFDSDDKFFYLILPFVVGATLVAATLFRTRTRTRIGCGFVAIRERDYALGDLFQAHGLRHRRVFGGIAGGLLAMFLRLVSPDRFLVTVSVFYLTAVLVGGRGSLLGSIVGATFMTMIPEVLRELILLLSGGPTSLASTLATFREFVFGALIVILLHVDPRGLVGLIEKLGVRIEFRGV